LRRAARLASPALLLASLLTPADKSVRRGLAVLFGIHLGLVATAGLLRSLGDRRT